MLYLDCSDHIMVVIMKKGKAFFETAFPKNPLLAVV